MSPLRELIWTAARIAETRDLTIPIPHAEAGEVSQLGRALESMVIELRDAELQLEGKVLERTEQLRASESALRDHSAQLDAVFNLSPDGFVSFDPTHHVASVNQAFLTMTGWTAADVKGLSAQQFAQRLAGQCLSDGALTSIDAMLSDPDGKPLALELAPPIARMLSIRTRQATSENVSQIWYFRDITHEAEVDRMKSEFLQVAAHELRTPMTSIYGFSELLLTRNMDEPQRRDITGRIFNQSKRVVSIVNELLDLARIEARRGKDFVIAHVDVDQSVAQLISEFSPPQGRDAPRVIGDAGSAFIKADRGKFDQVFINVLSNAFKYSPSGGDVDIAFRHEETAQQSLLGIEIRDHGIGMSPTQLKHVCERFFRADTTGAIPGTGLGMSIVKELLELHGGRLDLTSELGVGTTVTLWWPKA